MQVEVRVEYFQEAGNHVALAPDLSISVDGSSEEEARQGLERDVKAYLSDCVEMGIFENVLRQLGFEENNNVWVRRKPMKSEEFVLEV